MDGRAYTGRAHEIVIHSNDEDLLTVTLHGKSYAYCIKIYPEEESAVEECAIDFATNLEEATGLRWRVHDESRGKFTVD